MFFVSEEFLRRHEQGEEPRSTLGDVVALGESLFPTGEQRPRKARGREKASRG